MWRKKEMNRTRGRAASPDAGDYARRPAERLVAFLSRGPAAPHTIRWKLTVSSLLAIGIPLLMFAFFLASALWRFYLQQLEQELKTKALVVVDACAPILSPSTPDDPAGLARIVDGWQRYSNMRVTVANMHGIICAATVKSDVGSRIRAGVPPGMDAALAGHANATIWRSPSFAYEETMYVNQPVWENRHVIGAVRVAYSLAEIEANVRLIRRTLLATTLLYALLIAVLTMWLSGTIAGPVEALNRSAGELAAGRLDRQISVRGTSEVVSLAATLNQMAERLQRLEGLRRQYVSSVSHELRTPLAAIRGMAETLMQHGETDPDLQSRYLPRIIDHTDRLARLASQLLDLAQIESGNLVSTLAPVALDSVIEEALHTCTEQALHKGVQLSADLHRGRPEVLGDRDRLVQIFLNLLENAIRYTPAGGTVAVRSHMDGSCMIASVLDTGAGIAAEHLPYIFDRFYRADRSRSRAAGGSGLGLSIVRQIVEAHGGKIGVESTPGRGTCFTVTLPIVTYVRSPAPGLTSESG